jgi:hypothetical protein
VPERIRLSRSKGWRLPPGAVVVARPTKWGNPYVVGSVMVGAVHDDRGECHDGVAVALSREQCIDLYWQLWEERLVPIDGDGVDAAWVLEQHASLDKLVGLDLGCWCPLDEPCHADVLLALANTSPERRHDLARVAIAARDDFTTVGVAVWLDAPNLILGGPSARQLVEAGQADRVLSLIHALAEGVVM